MPLCRKNHKGSPLWACRLTELTRWKSLTMLCCYSFTLLELSLCLRTTEIPQSTGCQEAHTSDCPCAETTTPPKTPSLPPPASSVDNDRVAPSWPPPAPPPSQQFPWKPQHPELCTRSGRGPDCPAHCCQGLPGRGGVSAESEAATPGLTSASHRRRVLSSAKVSPPVRWVSIVCST